MRFSSIQSSLVSGISIPGTGMKAVGVRAPDPRGKPCGASAAVLLEVILALGLFVAAAALLGAALSAAIDGVERQRLTTHAGNLAVSVMSEIQLGIRGITESGAVPLAPPFDRWTAQVMQTPAESETGEPSGAVLIEVILRHQDPPMTHRLAQVIRPSELPSSEASMR